MSDDACQRDPPPDDGLVVQAKTDRKAFGLLFDRYYPGVLRYCIRRLYDRATAEDVTSEVFLNVAAHLRAFPGQRETDFRRWLFRIATNAVHAQLRQAGRRQALLERAARQGTLGPAAADRATGDDQLLDWPTVRRALEELDERRQTLVSLRFFASLSHEEIAEIVQSTPGAVRTALSRTLAELRQRFAGSRPAPPGV